MLRSCWLKGLLGSVSWLCCAGDALLRRKLGFLNFSAAAGWDPTEVLQVYLAAACDPNDQVSREVGATKGQYFLQAGHILLAQWLRFGAPGDSQPLVPASSSRHKSQVSRRGDELLKKRCGIDSQRPLGEEGTRTWPLAGWRMHSSSNP